VCLREETRRERREEAANWREPTALRHVYYPSSNTIPGLFLLLLLPHPPVSVLGGFTIIIGIVSNIIHWDGVIR